MRVNNRSNTYLFHFTYTYMQITLLLADFAEDKNFSKNFEILLSVHACTNFAS